MSLVPLPGTCDDRFQLIALRHPPEFPLRLLRGSNQYRRISGTTLDHAGRQRMSRDLARRLNHLQGGESIAVPQVVYAALLAVAEMLVSQPMRVGEIHDMNVIADAGAVFCRIIVTVNKNLIALPERHLQNERDEMRFRRMIF